MSRIIQKIRKKLCPVTITTKSIPTTSDLSLFLHIGMPKSGTTAIQNFLYKNRYILKKDHGVCYPDEALHWSQHVPVLKAIIAPHFPFARFNKVIPSVNLEEWLESVGHDCHVNRCEKVIVSSEFFWAAPAMQSPLAYHTDTPENCAHLKKAIELFGEAFSTFSEIKVVVYLRRQDHWLESFFNQQIKNGFPIPTEKDLLPVRNYLLYNRNLTWWCEVFGRQNVIIRTFEEARPDVIEDFCQIVGIRQSDSLHFSDINDNETVNSRLSPRALKVMLMAIEMGLDVEVKELLREVLTHTSARIPTEYWGKEGGVFSEELLLSVRAAYDADTQLLAERYPITSCYLSAEADIDKQILDGVEYHASWEEQTERLLEQLLGDMQTLSGNKNNEHKAE